MPYRIPFNEHVVIEADTAAEVRALMAEFGSSMPAPRLPPAAAPAPGTLEIVIPPVPPRRRATAVRQPTAPRGTSKASTRREVAPPADDQGELGARLLKLLNEKGPTSTGQLAKAAGSYPAKVKTPLDAMARKGLVHSEGISYSQRWHLGAKGAGARRGSAAAAKEVP